MPERIHRLFAEQVAALRAHRGLARLRGEGDVTGSTMVRHRGWTTRAVTHVWVQGVITLQQDGVHTIDLTIKPGSCAWPGEFRKLRLAGDRLRPHRGAT